MPTSAAARAAASFSPSPTISTRRPPACNAGHECELVFGRLPEMHVAAEEALPARALASWSPEIRQSSCTGGERRGYGLVDAGARGGGTPGSTPTHLRRPRT